MSTEADRIKETAKLLFGDESKTPSANLVPSQAEYNLRIAKDKFFGEIKKTKMQTKDDVLKYGALPDGKIDQGSIELANLIEEGKIKVYDNTILGNPTASATISKQLPGVSQLYNPTVTNLEFYSQFDKYSYPLAQQGNYFVSFNINSSNADIAAFSRDIYRITDTNNEEDLYNKLMISEWQNLIKNSFNIGRSPDDSIDIINDPNLGTFDLRAIAFVAKLKYHDPAKLTNPDFQNNRVFIGFKNQYFNEPIARLSRLANDAYIFLSKLPPIPNAPIPQEIEKSTPLTNMIAADNEAKEAELIRKIANETIRLSKEAELQSRNIFPEYVNPSGAILGLAVISIIAIILFSPNEKK